MFVPWGTKIFHTDGGHTFFIRRQTFYNEGRVDKHFYTRGDKDFMLEVIATLIMLMLMKRLCERSEQSCERSEQALRRS